MGISDLASGASPCESFRTVLDGFGEVLGAWPGRQEVQVQQIHSLTIDEVRSIHRALSHLFEQTSDPISPPGERDPGLLESAVGRQQTGWSGELKWCTPHANAASLMYGICMNHPFHNGNKRVALVACLNHMDRNKLAPCHVTHDELYELVRSLAGHDLPSTGGKREVRIAGLERRPGNWSPDEEIRYLAAWLKLRTRTVDKHEYPLTFRQLRQRLQPLGVHFSEPRKNFIDLTREVPSRSKSLLTRLGFRASLDKLRKNLSYAGDSEQVGVGTIKEIRRELRLCEEDGVDSAVIYGNEKPIENILNEYRTLLKRLARV